MNELKEAAIQFSNAVWILERLKDHVILVGSASRSDVYKDIDLVISEKGLKIAKQLFSNMSTGSAFVGNLKCFGTNPPIEVFTFWYGPSYKDLKRKYKKELISKTILGTELLAWPTKTN